MRRRWRWTPNGGAVIYVKRYAEAQPPGHYAMLAVSDTGQGMDAATRRQIFEPFFTTKERGKGTGLGLSVSHGIIQEHGGSIHLESRAGEGACFSIDLPIDRVAGDEGLSDESISSSTVG